MNQEQHLLYMHEPRATPPSICTSDNRDAGVERPAPIESIEREK